MSDDSNALNQLEVLARALDERGTDRGKVLQILMRVWAAGPDDIARLADTTDAPYQFAGLSTSRGHWQYGGKTLYLTQTEERVLRLLCAAKGAIVRRQEFFAEIWHEGLIGDPHVVDVHMSNLKRKLECAGAPQDFIVTKRGSGFYINSN